MICNKVNILLILVLPSFFLSVDSLALAEDNSAGTPFYTITISNLDKSLSGWDLESVYSGGTYFLSSDPLLEKPALNGQWGSKSLYDNTSYFSEKHLSRWQKGERGEIAGKFGNGLYSYFEGKYNDHFSPFLNRNNTIIVGMMFSQYEPDVEEEIASSVASSADLDTVNMEYEYEDRDMDALLHERAQEEDFGADIVLEAAAGPTVENLRMRLADEWRRNPFARTVLVPFNLDNLHWVGLVIRFNSENQVEVIQYVDPLGSPLPKKVREVLQVLYGHNTREGIRLVRERIQEILVLRQMDGTACGPLTIENLIRVAQNRLEIERADDAVTRQIRNHHINLLEQNRRDLNFNYRQEHNIRSFSYPGILPRIFLTHVNQEELSENDRLIIQEIIALCRRVIISCEVNPLLLTPANLGPNSASYRRYFRLELAKPPEYWPEEYQFAEPLYVREASEEKVRANASNYVHLYEDLNRIFELSTKVSWRVKNDPRYQMIPWKHLDFMREVLIGNTGYPKETQALLEPAVVDFIRDHNGGLVALYKGFESILSTQSPSVQPVLFRQLAGFYYDNLIYQDMLKRLGHLVAIPDSSLPWKLALLRTMQVAGEHFKSLVWVGTKPELVLPRKILLDGRDELSHIRVEQLPRFIEFLKTPMDENARRDCCEFLRRAELISKEQISVRIGAPSAVELWARIRARDLTRHDLEIGASAWPGFAGVLQALERPVVQASMGGRARVPDRRFIDGVVDLLLPFPSYYQQTEDFFEHRKNLTENIFDNPGRSVLEFRDTLVRHHIPLFREVDLNSVWNELYDDYYEHKVLLLNAIGNGVEDDYRQHQDALQFIERKLLKTILQVDDSEIEKFEKNKKEKARLEDKRAKLKNALEKAAKMPVSTDYRLVQKQYVKFKSEVEEIIEAQVSDADYHQSHPGFLESIFSQLASVQVEEARAKQVRRINGIREVDHLINILRELFNIQYTVTTEAAYGFTEAGQRNIKGIIFNKPQSFTPNLTQRQVEAMLKASPIHLDAAEYLISIICECIIKELDHYPEFNGLLSQLDVVRNFIDHPDATYRNPLVMRDNTTYIRNPTATIAQQVAQLAINVKFIIEEILSSM